MRVDRLSIEYGSTAQLEQGLVNSTISDAASGKPLLIHGLAGSWRSGNPILNQLAVERGVGELEYEYEESPSNAPSANQPIFVKTVRKKENRIISVSNVVVSSSMIMNPTPSDSQSVKSEFLKMYVNAIR